MSSTDIAYYGLLYLDRENNLNPNTRKTLTGRDAADPIDIYILNAATCAKSARHFGIRYAVITNKAQLMQERMDALGITELRIVEHHFSREIPRKIPFYSAHFKLELLEAFGTGQYGSAVGMIDVDTVFLGKLPVANLDENALQVYDVTDQIVPAYGIEDLRRNLAAVSGTEFANPAWFGGEAIAGTPEAFKRLATRFNEFWPRYLRSIPELTHVNDEPLVSSALNSLRLEGMRLYDWGATGQVQRWFSASTLHPQPPLRQVLPRCRLLHLPTDKEFLGASAPLAFDPEEIIKRYQIYSKGRLLRRRVVNTLKVLAGKRRKYVASL